MLTRLKDPGSAITHFIGMVLSASACFPLLLKAARYSSTKTVISLFVFILSMILLYMASTAYHTFDISTQTNRILQKLDHIMISVLIAGTYTPLCTTVISGRMGKIVFITIWSLALLSTILNLFYITCPKWLSSIVYVIMGWTCVMAFPQIIKGVSLKGFFFLLGGGIFYTVGSIIYAIKMPVFNEHHPQFGNHEIFHLFVIAGSICHFILMYAFVA